MLGWRAAQCLPLVQLGHVLKESGKPGLPANAYVIFTNCSIQALFTDMPILGIGFCLELIWGGLFIKKSFVSSGLFLSLMIKTVMIKTAAGWVH